MILAVDIGNTQTTMALVEGERASLSWRLSTRAPRTADELAVTLKGLLEIDNVEVAAIDGVAIGSVVRHLTPIFATAQRKVLGREPLIITGQTPMPVENGYDDPSAVGVDRLANAVAGVRRFGAPLVVVDFGTAITADVISGDAVYLGGMIAPGPEMAADALFSGTSRLPRVPIEPPTKPIGRTTSDSIQSGLFHGTVGLVDELVRRAWEELGGECAAVATGGLASLFARHCRTIRASEPLLTLLGLAEILRFQSHDGDD